MYEVLLKDLWTLQKLVAGDSRPRCGEHTDPESVRAGLGVQGARAVELALWVYAQGHDPLFASSGSENQGRGFESKLLGLKVGGQI